jgi:Na+/proline symporter
VVNLVFLSLGALLYLYASQSGIGSDVKPDMLFAEIALHENTGTLIGVLFLLGVIAAAYSSADSALTSLTTSFSVDFLNVEKKQEQVSERIRKNVHIVMSGVIVLVVLLLKYVTDESAIGLLMKLAGFTYGPLIGLFFFGIITKRKLEDKLVPVVSLIATLLMFFFWYYSTGAPGVEKGSLGMFGAYRFGFEIIIYNAIFSYVLLLFISKKNPRLT